jgi:hypothetical protein
VQRRWQADRKHGAGATASAVNIRIRSLSRRQLTRAGFTVAWLCVAELATAVKCEVAIAVAALVITTIRARPAPATAASLRAGLMW